jgi:thiamine biosynthesis protein ThiI
MSLVVVRYHEITLKRGNRSRFAAALVQNIRRAASDLPVGRIADLEGRIVAVLRDDASWPVLRERLSRIFGIANFSLAKSLPTTSLGEAALPDLRPLGSAILDTLGGRTFESFRIVTKRADKRFPLGSPQVSAAVGAMIREASVESTRRSPRRA